MSTNPFSQQLAQAKQAKQASLPAGEHYSEREPVENVTYVYGKNILLMNRQETIQAIQRLESYRSDLRNIETSAKALDFHVKECSTAIEQLVEHLNDLN